MSEFNFNDVIDVVKLGAKKAKTGAETAAKTVAKQTNSLIGQAKLSYAASEIEDKIELLKKEIGEIIYRESKNMESIPEDIAERCKKIEELNIELASIKEKIAEFKEKILCAECGEYNSATAVYCSKCGNKLDDLGNSPNNEAAECETEKYSEPDTITIKPRKKDEE